MPQTYPELVTQAKEFLNHRLEQLNDLSDPQQQTLVDTVYHTASLFGLQKLVDLSSFLRECLADRVSVGADLLGRIVRASMELVESWTAPPPHGEFVKDGLVALRPLFSHTVDLGPLIRDLRAFKKPNWQMRISFCLPVVLQAEYPYALKIPTKFFQQENPEFKLHLFYIDWNNQRSHDWLSAIALIKKWERNGDLIYHGALEVPVRRVLERRDILPYYVVFRLRGDAERFLAAEDVQAFGLCLIGSQTAVKDADVLLPADEPSLLRKASSYRIAQGRIVHLNEESTEQAREQEIPFRKLSLIPFRVADLDDPTFEWPQPPAEIRLGTSVEQAPKDPSL